MGINQVCQIWNWPDKLAAHRAEGGLPEEGGNELMVLDVVNLGLLDGTTTSVQRQDFLLLGRLLVLWGQQHGWVAAFLVGHVTAVTTMPMTHGLKTYLALMKLKTNSWYWNKSTDWNRQAKHRVTSRREGVLQAKKKKVTQTTLKNCNFKENKKTIKWD